MVFNYDAVEDSDNVNYSSTVEFFPDMSQFCEAGEELENNDEEEYELSEWAVMKIGTLQSRLESMQNSRDSKKCFRSKDSLNSLSSHVVVNLANEIFGYDGWSSEMLNYYLIDESIDDESQQYSATYNATVRVTLKEGIYSDGLGTGEAINLPSKCMCYNKGKKQAVTDGMKKAIISLRDILMEHELKKLQRDLKLKCEDSRL